MSPVRLPVLVVIALALGCGKSSTEPTPAPPPPPAPTVQSVTVAPGTGTLTSLGETTTLTAVVHLSNGSNGSQTPSWTTSAASIATVAGGTVTAVGNGEATITAAVGSVSGTAVITVAQAVASVQLLPGDTVIKSVAHLRGTALDARDQPVADAPIEWEALTPAITSVDESGNLTPHTTGVARVKITSGTFSSTALVRTVWNVTQLSDLFPLFEYVATTGQRRALSDVSQAHADARATVMGPLWTYLTTLLPSSGSDVTDMYFTTWPEIWTEFNPFCGGQLFEDQVNWTSCAAPHRTHFFIPGAVGDDYGPITRFLARQFLIASQTASGQFPWFLEGFTQWLAGGTAQAGGVSGRAAPVSIADFAAGDTQGLLAPLDSLMRRPAAEYFENLPARTPVAVRMAQGVMLVSYLATLNQGSALCQIFAAIRASPGAGVTNDGVIQLMLTGTGKTVPELESEYLVHARGLVSGTVAQETVIPAACPP